MNNRYLYLNKDGNINLVNILGSKLEDYCKKKKTKIKDYILYDEEIFDNEFFGGYTIKGGKVVEILDKCIEIKIEKLRIKRNEKLSNMDIDYIRALESDNKQLCKSIVELKKELRDLPDQIRSKKFEDLKELKVYQPDCLK